jgi:signal transduction histidine kinase
MGRRAALLMALAMLWLGGGACVLGWRLYRAAERSIEELMVSRLQAVGTTAALWLPLAPDPNAALAALADANQLDDASLIDAQLRLVADARGRTGRRANLLRVDPDRAYAALAGHASIGWAFDLDGVRFFGGYFPVAGDGTRALSIEAGAGFVVPSTRLRATASFALALAVGLATLALFALALAVRAVRKEREAYGRVERAGIASRMAAMVAHEVRNPLGIIRGSADLLREATSEDKVHELLADIVGEVDRINRLTEDFLTLGRDLPLQRVAVDLRELADATVDAVRRRSGARAPSFTITGNARIEADAPRLRQALLNLLVNASEACTPTDTVRIEIATTARDVSMVIEDSGPGIPTDVAARLFDPFVTGKATGTGLGLAISRKIVEQHGGRIVHAPSSQGARFEIWLPSASSE